jgi:hypothetical protein
MGMKKGTAKSRQRGAEPGAVASPTTFRELFDVALARLREEATAAAGSLGFTADANLQAAVKEELEWWIYVDGSEVGSPQDAEDFAEDATYARLWALEAICSVMNPCEYDDVGDIGEWTKLVDEYLALMRRAVPYADKRPPTDVKGSLERNRRARERFAQAQQELEEAKRELVAVAPGFASYQPAIAAAA